MPDRPVRRDLPLPGAFNGECVRCGGSVPKVVRSGLAAYLCDRCIEMHASGSVPAFQSQRVFGTVEDD
jgi:hypothetical protein